MEEDIQGIDELKEIHLYGITDILSEAAKKVDAGDYTAARDMIEEIIKQIEDTDEYKDTDDTVYRALGGPIEHLICLTRHDTDREIKYTPEPYASLYLSYGDLLMGMGDTDGAMAAFDKASHWNPVNANIIFARADVFRVKEQLEDFKNETIKVFDNAYTSGNLARAYRNIGFYFVEKELWREAMGSYLMSLHYDSENTDVQKEISYIQTKSEGSAGVPSIEEFRETAKEHDIPTGPVGDIIGMAASYASQAESDGREDVARYFYAIVYDLTGDEEIAKKLEQIENTLFGEGEESDEESEQ